MLCHIRESIDSQVWHYCVTYCATIVSRLCDVRATYVTRLKVSRYFVIPLREKIPSRRVKTNIARSKTAYFKDVTDAPSHPRIMRSRMEREGARMYE